MNRRNILKNMGLAAAAGAIAFPKNSFADKVEESTKGLPPLKITDVKVIATAPQGANLVVVKVFTSEPGLYGLGCATFTQRASAVVTTLEDYVKEFCIGKDVDNIEDCWKSLYVNSYWRNGPVLNNAISGIDQALWDIKGKRANMPVYQLLGGKARFAVPCYTHASGKTAEQVADKVQEFMDMGFRHVRIQQGGYSGPGNSTAKPDFKDVGFALADDGFMDQGAYLRSVPKMFETVRKRCGEEVELLHDVHERVNPIECIQMIKELEQYHPFFIEDPFSPENMEWFRLLRKQTSVPIAMGELFNNINEFKEPIVEQLFDYIRIHISQIGGISPAMKVARLGEFFNIKTAWHAPGDCSPVGHAANAHIDLAVWNFGIQEGKPSFPEKVREVFPGCPTVTNGYMSVNEVPGLGVDINEKEAAKYPIKTESKWQVRSSDGTIITP